jgi:hypothetical protein
MSSSEIWSGRDGSSSDNRVLAMLHQPPNRRGANSLPPAEPNFGCR